MVPGLTHDNTASVTTDEAAGDDGSASIPIFQNPQIAVTKTADVASVDAAGDEINYTVTVDNTGNMTLTSVTVSDSLVTLTLASAATPTTTANSTSTRPGPTPAAIRSRSPTSTTAAWSIRCWQKPIRRPPTRRRPLREPASASVDVVQNPDLTITKTADVSSVDAAGDVINYTVIVDNVGNMTLTGVTVTDTLTTLTLASGDTDNDGKLDLGETWTYTGSYTVQQSDIDNGGVVNPLLAINNTATADTAQTAPEASLRFGQRRAESRPHHHQDARTSLR